jgi:hypothetical protein
MFLVFDPSLSWQVAVYQFTRKLRSKTICFRTHLHFKPLIRKVQISHRHRLGVHSLLIDHDAEAISGIVKRFLFNPTTTCVETRVVARKA